MLFVPKTAAVAVCAIRPARVLTCLLLRLTSEDHQAGAGRAGCVVVFVDDDCSCPPATRVCVAV